MKIWYQSGAALGKNERYHEYFEMLKTHLQNVARPGTEVSVRGVERSSPIHQLSRYEEVLHNYQVAENFLQAQKEGYDGFCVGCALDPAFYSIREIAEIPYCTLSEANMFLACLLAPNFALFCHNKQLLLRVSELVHRYRLDDRFIAIDSLGMKPAELNKAFDDPEFFLKPAREVARDAAGKGVTMFVVAEGIINMILVKHNITQIEGIPVIEGSGALVKITEMMVDLKKMGIGASRQGLYAALPEGGFETLRQIYKPSPKGLDCT
ncbi:MAG: aspartate/glutamate racemase family protein [Chloroflexota bacterium]